MPKTGTPANGNATGSSDKPPVPNVIAYPIEPIEIFDVGAMIEGRERYARLSEHGLANVTGFEPNPAEFDRLRDHFPSRQYHCCFLGRGGPATLYITRFPGCISLYEPDPGIIDLFQRIGTILPHGNFGVVDVQPVQTVRLDDIPNLPACDYCKLDVQGSELDVLEGAPRALGSALIVEIEVCFLPLYKGQPTSSAVAGFMEARGFLLHKFIDVCGRPFKPMSLQESPSAAISQMLWADAVFIRDFSKLSAYTDAQLIKAAAILYDCYDSHDLAYVLLAEHDRRRQTLLAPAFAQTLSRISNLPLTYLNIKPD